MKVSNLGEDCDSDGNHGESSKEATDRLARSKAHLIARRMLAIKPLGVCFLYDCSGDYGGYKKG